MLRQIRLISSAISDGCELSSGRGQPPAFYTDETDMAEAEKNRKRAAIMDRYNLHDMLLSAVFS
jgi:hypothetical protein